MSAWIQSAAAGVVAFVLLAGIAYFLKAESATWNREKKGE